MIEAEWRKRTKGLVIKDELMIKNNKSKKRKVKKTIPPDPSRRRVLKPRDEPKEKD